MKYQGNYKINTQIECAEIFEGQSIEEKLRKATTTNEPIESILPEVYTEKKDGVLPQYDIRTDRFELALEAQTKGEKMRTAQTEEKKVVTEQKKEE